MDLSTPLGDEVLTLKAGDRVTLSGVVYTARDEAHLEMMRHGIPFDPVGAAVYHCGPVIGDDRVIAAGPTTSARMNRLSGLYCGWPHITRTVERVRYSFCRARVMPT